MLKILRALLLVLILPLAACALQDMLGLSPTQDADLRAVFDKVRAGDLGGVEAAFDPQYRTATLHEALPGLRHQIPAGTARARLLKGVVQTDKGRTDYGGIYAYDFPHEAILVDVQMRQDKTGHKSITAFNLRQAEPGIADRYAFGLSGKKYYQYIFLFLTALSPGLGIWGLVALWRAPDIRWKWLWALAMTVGFMDLTMDWTTGDVFLNVAELHFLWIYAKQFGPLSPWMISTSLPVAAIAFLLGYRPPRLQRPWDGPKP